jgi:hypothetical protein
MQVPPMLVLRAAHRFALKLPVAWLPSVKLTSKVPE